MSLVKAKHFRTQWLADRAKELHEPLNMHRKLWEFAIISNMAREEITALKIEWAGDTLRPYVLGFGVGTEPLPAWFAQQGCDVLATDCPDDTGQWNTTGQYADNVNSLQREWCSQFYNITFRPVDMNAIPQDLHGQFDILYSAGSLEHIGGLEHSLQFICKAMKCLRPGGLALHTTEFTHGKVTIDTPGLCAFQEKHFAELGERLKAQGDYLYSMDFSRGTDWEDKTIVKPSNVNSLPHLSLLVSSNRGIVITSVVFAIRRNPNA
jgi:2-polyprenyl-3-methyl-5-hydroxy-6-metoxy-1,4-benzoquinol methylase